MRRIPAVIVTLVVFLSPSASPAAESVEVALKRSAALPLPELYARTAPAVVGILCEHGESQVSYYGTGTLLDAKGLVLTSVSVVPHDEFDSIQVFLQGGGRAAAAKLLKADRATEVSILRVERLDELLGEAEGLPYVRLGDSRKLRVGDAAYSFGNAFQSIRIDDSVVFAAGLVSGLFELDELRPEATYLGPAIETSAAVNSGMDGGPLVNARGEIIGLLSLNYSRSRWLGTAVPIHVLEPVLSPYLARFDDRSLGCQGFAGIEVEEVPRGGIRVVRVQPGGPAAAAGLTAGDEIVSFRGQQLESVVQLRELFVATPAGERVEWGVRRRGENLNLSSTLWGRF